MQGFTLVETAAVVASLIDGDDTYIKVADGCWYKVMEEEDGVYGYDAMNPEKQCLQEYFEMLLTTCPEPLVLTNVVDLVFPGPTRL